MPGQKVRLPMPKPGGCSRMLLSEALVLAAKGKEKKKKKSSAQSSALSNSDKYKMKY